MMDHIQPEDSQPVFQITLHSCPNLPDFLKQSAADLMTVYTILCPRAEEMS